MMSGFVFHRLMGMLTTRKLGMSWTNMQGRRREGLTGTMMRLWRAAWDCTVASRMRSAISWQ